jgi:sulfite reductase subunit B
MSGNCRCGDKKDIYLPEMATVVRSEPMTKMEQFFSFKMDSRTELGHEPGQFAEMSIPGIGEAPISVSSAPSEDGTFEMVVRNVGNVSSAMHGLKAGDKIGVRGPFGTSFPVAGEMKGQDILFVAGGIGLVPLRSAIQYVLNNREDYGHVTILFGTRTPADRLFVDELKAWEEDPDITFMETVDMGNDDWQGNVGVITTLMPKIEIDAAKTVALICGPPIMYKFVIVELEKLGVTEDRTYVSLERHMKCGVGKCGHCQVNNLYVCQDGPVFKYADITAVEEAI